MKSPKTSHTAFRGKLLAYSTAAGAALAGSAHADAQTITNITVTSLGGTPSLSSAGTSASFGPSNGLQFTYYRSSHIAFVALAGQADVELAFSNVNLQKLDAGRPIAGNSFATGSARVAFGRLNSYTTGVFGSAGAGYGGFKTGGGQYGWLRLRVTRDGDGLPNFIGLSPDESGIVGAIGDSSITAGQVAAAAVPEPASAAAGLGLLALGAAGIREHRRRKQQAA